MFRKKIKIPLKRGLAKLAKKFYNSKSSNIYFYFKNIFAKMDDKNRRTRTRPAVIFDPEELQPDPAAHNVPAFLKKICDAYIPSVRFPLPGQKKHIDNYMRLVGGLFNSTETPAIAVDVRTVKACTEIVERFKDWSGAFRIYGERGSGKELVAQYIHKTGPHKEKIFIAVNCAAIPQTLVESELFGTTKGAFTGAVDRPGVLENSNGGILFLDETGWLPLSAQAKLLRCTQEKEVQRVGGGTKRRPFEAQILIGSNVRFEELIEKEKLLPDLYDRLNGPFIHVPSLLERSDLEKKALATYFILQKMRDLIKPKLEVPDLLFSYLYSIPYEGNIRELKARCELLVCDGFANLLGLDKRVEELLESLSAGTVKRMQQLAEERFGLNRQRETGEQERVHPYMKCLEILPLKEAKSSLVDQFEIDWFNFHRSKYPDPLMGKYIAQKLKIS